MKNHKLDFKVTSLPSVKYLSLSLIIGCFSIGCTESKTVFRPTPIKVFADSLFQASVDGAYIAGASVLIFQKGQKLLDKSYGYASLELAVPMPENPSFEIGSVTKQFTAAAILKLVEQKKLSLEDDFTKYLNFDTKGRSITIRQLLNHTSGIPSYTEIPEFWNLSMHTFGRDSLVRLVEEHEFLFEPGEALVYNNSAYFFLGLIIEKVSAMSYENFLAEQFFNPLGMKHTYYCSTSTVRQDKVYGYNFNPNGLQQKPYLDHTWPYAAGSLCSTTDDLLTWMQALHTGQVFDAKQYQSFVTPGALSDGTPIRYAMGLANFSNHGNRNISHGGGINGFLSQSTYYPDEDLYIVCLVNTTGPHGAGFFVNALTWQFLSKKEYPTQPIDIDLESLEGSYTGQARGQMLKVNVSALSDGLTLLTEGQGQVDTLQIYIGDGTWMDGNDIITFTPNGLSIDDIFGHYKLVKQ